MAVTVKITNVEITGGRVTVTGEVAVDGGTPARVTVQQWQSYLDTLPTMVAKRAFMRAQLKAEYLGQASQAQPVFVDPAPVET